METPKKVKTEIIYTYKTGKKEAQFTDLIFIEIRFWRNHKNDIWKFNKCDFNLSGNYTLADWQFLSEIYKLSEYHLKDLNK